MGDEERDLITQTAEATSKAMAEALAHLRLHPAPNIRLCKFFDRPQKVGDLTITEWLRDVDVYTRQMGFEGEDKLAALTDHLGGNAREEYLCADPVVKNDFNKLSSLLKRRFGPAEELPALSAAFSSRVQQEGENLTAYSRALMRLYARMEAAAEDLDVRAALERLKDMSLKGQFKKGVASDSVSKDVERMDIHKPKQSFNEMREEIIKLYGDAEAGSRKPRVRQVEAPDVLVETIQTSVNNDGSANGGAIQALLDSQRQTNDRLDKIIGAMGQIPSASSSSMPGYAYAHPSFAPYIPVPQAGAYRYQDCTYIPSPQQAAPPVSQQGSLSYANRSALQYGPAGAAQYNQSYQSHDGSIKRGSCYYCGVYGHYRQDCPTRRAKRQATVQHPQGLPAPSYSSVTGIPESRMPTHSSNYPTGAIPMSGVSAQPSYQTQTSPNRVTMSEPLNQNPKE